MTPWIFIVGGLLLLTSGAEILVRGAAALARRWGVSALIVGLTVVAFGTSAPELVVSTRAALGVHGAVAIGNAVGSNIFNGLVILGASALIAPLVVEARLVRLDVPVMIGVTAGLWVLILDGDLDAVDGAILLLGLALHLGWTVRTARSGAGREDGAGDAPAGVGASSIRVFAGLAALVAGAELFLHGALDAARAAGVSERVLGLTLVAAGTSLPELATSMVAAWRGERDIAVGNIVGSNIFNLLGVLGCAATIAPGGLAVESGMLHLDLPVCLAAAVACLPIVASGHRVSRGEGAVLLIAYGAYLAWLLR